MPNSKAEKIELKLPPFLSLSHGEFTIDDTMSKLEENNAPFINERLQPLYKREITETKPVIYDKDGNQYKIENSFFTKNGVNLFRVASKKFVREDVSDTFSGYLSYDIDENDKVIYSTFDYSTNRVTIHLDGSDVQSNPLFNEGTVIEARTKIIDNIPYTVVVYKDEGNHLMFMFYDGSFQYKSITWRASRIRRSSSATYETITPTDINQEYPLIQIAKVYDGVIGISFVNEYSSVMTSYEVAYSTWFLYNGTLYELGNSLIPSNDNIPKQQVTTTTQVYFHTHVTRNSTVARGDCILVNNKWRDYTGQVVGEELDFPEGYVPALTGSVTIEGVTYTTGTWRRYDAISAVQCVTNDDTINYTFKVNGTAAPSETPNQVVLVNSNYFNVEYSKIEKMEIVWQNITTEIPISYLERNYLIERTSTTLQTVSYLAYPNVVLDNGNMYTMFRFVSATSSWANSLSAGNYIVESGKVSAVSLSNSILTYTITSLEEVAITSNYNNVRSNSYSVGQNFFQSTVKLNNSASPTPEALQAGTATDEAKNAQRFLEYTNSNCYDLSYFPGTNRLSDRNYYDTENNIGPGEDLAVFTSIGGRSQLGNSPFNVLYNTFISGISTIQGISYSEFNEEMGTLLTEWQSVDGDSYIAANSHSVIYRDKNNKIWKISIVEAEPELMTVFDDTFILINTTSFWNSFDTKSGKKFHYATDYNDRAVAGEKSVPSDSDLTSYKDAYVRMRISAINAAFRSIPRYQIASEILRVNTTLRCSTNFQSYNCECPEDRDTQGIDVYFSDRGNSTLPRYRFTIYPYGYGNTDVVSKNSDLIGTSYVSNDNVLISPNIFTSYINGAGNNDMVKEGWTNYALTYYQDRPFFLYSTGTELDEVQHFFVIQGQFYAIIHDKIYSVIYTNGVITELEAIVDVRDFVFIGNTPSIAFFWSPSYRAFYSFTGDANLEFLFPGNKFSEIEEDHCFYDEATQTIYASTDRGLLVFGPKNTYLLYDITGVKNVQFTNDHLTHIITNGKIYDFCFYPRAGFVSNNVKLETEFMGVGNTTSTTIDRWSITIQTEDITKESWIKVGVRSITDVTVKSEEKTIQIRPTDWDKWSKCVLINYNPQIIKGQGIRLYLETPDSVCHIVGHVMNNSGTTLSKYTA